jgi:hypothetical protein
MEPQTQKQKKNHTLLIILAVSILIIITLSFANFMARAQANNIPQPTSISMKQSQAMPSTDKCLANNAAIKREVQALKGLSEDGGLWTSYIYDVPAGTNVDVNVATHNKKGVVTGSLAYDKPYGSYNFTITRQSDGWRYTQFSGCR